MAFRGADSLATPLPWPLPIDHDKLTEACSLDARFSARQGVDVEDEQSGGAPFTMRHRTATLSQTHFTEIESSHDKEIADVILSGLREFNADREGFASQDPEFYHLSVFFSQLRRTGSGNYWVIINSETQRVIGGGGYAPLKGWNSGANRDFGRVAELQKLYLLKPYRGLGLAGKLVGKILQAMKEDGYNTAYLETLSDMDKACNLYEGFGFQDVDGPMGCTGHSGCTRFMTLQL